MTYSYKISKVMYSAVIAFHFTKNWTPSLDQKAHLTEDMQTVAKLYSHDL